LPIISSEGIHFTSDHHFGHANIIRYSDRPFGSVWEMDETFITNWNEAVGPEDTVYHLGDIFLGDLGAAKRIRERLHGRICLIRGNHDKTADAMGSGSFEWIKDYHELKVADADLRGGVQMIVLCHYAMRIWNAAHRGSWQLYGHSHGSLQDDPEARAFDAGVDCHDYAPISYNQVKQIMARKSFFPVDHHGRDRHH